MHTRHLSGMVFQMASRTPLPTRERIFNFVRERVLEGTPPSVREVARAMNFRAAQSAQEHLDALVKSGRLRKEEGQSRGYRLPHALHRAEQLFAIPLLGRVQAGALSTAVEDLDGYVNIGMSASKRTLHAHLFALRVRGESMKNAGILHGDILIVHQKAEVKNGDIVVALVGDEATVKRFHRTRSHVELRPENDAFSPIIVQAKDALTILGKVIEVRRTLS